MASFFGEVLPLVSRAVDDDDEEDDTSYMIGPPILRWTDDTQKELMTSGKFKCDTFMIAVGPTATGFVEVFVKNQDVEELGVMLSHSLNEEDENEHPRTEDKCCVIYRLRQRPATLFCTCPTQLQPEQAFSCVEQITSCMNLEKATVLVLDSCSATDYKCLDDQNLTLPLLRCLTTKSLQMKPVCPYLEQPNTVPGISAQVLSYCQVHGVPAVLYMCFTETMYLESDSIRVYKNIFKTPSFTPLFKENPNAAKLLKKMVDRNAQQNTLYL